MGVTRPQSFLRGVHHCLFSAFFVRYKVAQEPALVVINFVNKSILPFRVNYQLSLFAKLILILIIISLFALLISIVFVIVNKFYIFVKSTRVEEHRERHRGRREYRRVRLV